jgi:hypothetical protein
VPRVNVDVATEMGRPMTFKKTSEAPHVGVTRFIPKNQCRNGNFAKKAASVISGAPPRGTNMLKAIRVVPSNVEEAEKSLIH